MIKHKLVNKGSLAHSLISPVNHPNILIPVKVIIKDIKFDEDNPQYLVKIVKFYDNIYLLQKYFMNNSFSNGFGKKPRNFWISSEINTVQLLENYLEKEASRFFVVVDSVHTTRYKNELEDLFNKIQDFLILRNIHELKELSTRNFYTGKLNLDTKAEFLIRLKRMISDKVVDAKTTWNQFIKSL